MDSKQSLLQKCNDICNMYVYITNNQRIGRFELEKRIKKSF